MKQYLMDTLEQIKAFYVKDIEALTDEQLLGPVTVGGTTTSARVPIDFTYEVVMINRLVLDRLLRQPVTPPNQAGWEVAPPEFRNRESAIAGITDSIQEIVKFIGQLDEAHLSETVPTSSGESTIYDMVFFAIIHTNYHNAQISYVQQLAGDMKMHWM